MKLQKQLVRSKRKIGVQHLHVLEKLNQTNLI